MPASPSTSTSKARTPITARRSSASRTGSIRSWAPPTTAIAACPTCVLAAPLKSDGTWNSAHFKNKDYDTLVGQYIAALDLQSQRAVAGNIQKLLLDETPVLFTYFYDFLTATTKKVAGAQATAMGQLFLARASLT